MKAPQLCMSALLAFALPLSSCGSVGPSTRPAQKARSETPLPPRCEASSVLECEAVCTNGDWAACEMAGLGYLKGTDITQDLRRARILLQRSCESARPKACAGYAKMALDNQGPKLRKEQIASYLEVGCTAGDLDACARRGNQRFYQEGPDRDPAQAVTLWQKACDGGEMSGCFQLGLSAKTGRAGSKRDTVEAVSLLTRACESSLAEACYEVAQLQLSPGDAASNAGQGQLHLEKACELKLPVACSRVALTYQHARGVPRDLVKARHLHRFACASKVQESCVGLAELLDEEPQNQLKLYTRACEAGLANACFEQASRIERSQNLTPEQTEAVETGYAKACEKGLSTACGRLGLRLALAPSLKRRTEAAKLLEQGCAGGDMPEACLKLGQWYAAGEPIPRDGVRATALLGPLCHGTETTAPRPAAATRPASAKSSVNYGGEACYPLARVVLFGYQVPENALGAANLFAEGCNLDHNPSCLALAEQQWLGLGGIKKTPEKAVAVFREQCDEQVGQACADLGYALQQGVGVTQDLDKARSLFEAQCKAGNQLGCAYLGNLLNGARNAERERGQKLLLSACDAASGKACWFLAENAQSRSKERAKLLERACTLEVLEACAVLKHERAK